MGRLMTTLNCNFLPQSRVLPSTNSFSISSSARSIQQNLIEPINSVVVPLASVETSFPSLCEVLQIHTNNFDSTTTRSSVRSFLVSELSHVILDKTSPNASTVQKCFVRMTSGQKTGEIDTRESVEESLRMIDLSAGQAIDPSERLPQLRFVQFSYSFESSEIIFSSLTRLFRLQPTLPTILAEKGQLVKGCNLIEFNCRKNYHQRERDGVLRHEGTDCLDKHIEADLGDDKKHIKGGTKRVVEEGTFFNILEWIFLAIPESDDLDGNAPPHTFARLAPDLIMFIASDNTTVSQAARTAFERVIGMTPSEADVFLTQTSLDIHTAENGMILSSGSHIPTETSLLRQARSAVATVCGSRKDSDEIFSKGMSSPRFYRDLLQLYTCTAALAVFLSPSASSPPPAKLSHLVRCVLEFGALSCCYRGYELTLYEAEHILEVIQQIDLRLFPFVDVPTKIALSSVFPGLPKAFATMKPDFSFQSLVRIGKVLLSEGLSTDPRISRNLLAFFDTAGDETVKTACRSLLTNHLAKATSTTTKQSPELGTDNTVRSEEVAETDVMCHLVRLMDGTSSSSKQEFLLPLGTYLLWDVEKIRSFQASPDPFLPELLSQVSRLDSPVIASNALNALSHSLNTFPTHFQSTSTKQIVSAVVDTLSSLQKSSTQVFCFAFTLNSFGKSKRVAKAAMNCAWSLINSGAPDRHLIAPLLEPFVSADDSSLVTRAVDTVRLLMQKTHFSQNRIQLNSRVGPLVEILADVWLFEVVNIAKSDQSLCLIDAEWRRHIVPDQCGSLIEACHRRLLTILSTLLKPRERNECGEVGIIASLPSLPVQTIIKLTVMALNDTVYNLTPYSGLTQRFPLSRDIIWRGHTLLVRLGTTSFVDYCHVIDTLRNIFTFKQKPPSLEPLIDFYAERILDAIDKVPKERWQFLSVLSRWTRSKDRFLLGDASWRRLVEKVKEEGIEDQLPLNFKDVREGFPRYLGLNCPPQSQP
ncbi:hypothetical protein BLNAU_20512 [Blattamonas nauphoetae]|uniref:Uncharacterized protein n=1 Tax=Blattamonas nauphoetae TaxID=2049346 RepID=A0ABQ9WYG2_9EUKA|nr:hypothetical protein BLNAU_20512 [Blattamonas nauphoetae]